MTVLPDNCIALGIHCGPTWCRECDTRRVTYVACLEVVLSGEDNHLLGIEARVRFRDCWHKVPGQYMSARLLAKLLDYGCDDVDGPDGDDEE